MEIMNEMAVDYLQRGITLMERRNYKEAIECFQKALEIEPRYAEAYSAMSDAYANLEDYKQALEYQKKVILLEPEDGEAYFDMGNIYILMDDILRCVENYNKAEEKGYSSFALYKNLAEIYREIKEEELALRNYNKAIKVEPLRADIRLEKAGYYILNGHFQEALETLEDLQKIAPDLYDAYEMRAEIYSGLHQYDKALELLNGAMKILPKDVALPVVKMKILVRMGNLQEAKKEIGLVKTMDNYPDVARNVFLQEAQIAALEKDMEKARECLEKIIALSDSYDEEAQFLLMNVYNGLGKEEKVLEIAETLSQTGTDNLYSVSGMYYVPHILMKQGKKEQAIKEFRSLASYLRKLTVSNPHFYEAYLYRLMCHKELGEFEKALELADYIQALDSGSSDAYAMRYSIYKEMGDAEKAAEMKKIAEKLNPQLQL